MTWNKRRNQKQEKKETYVRMNVMVGVDTPGSQSKTSRNNRLYSPCQNQFRGLGSMCLLGSKQGQQRHIWGSANKNFSPQISTPHLVNFIHFLMGSSLLKPLSPGPPEQAFYFVSDHIADFW
jgi:hypothetical protein